MKRLPAVFLPFGKGKLRMKTFVKLIKSWGESDAEETSFHHWKIVFLDLIDPKKENCEKKKIEKTICNDVITHKIFGISVNLKTCHKKGIRKTGSERLEPLGV